MESSLPDLTYPARILITLCSCFGISFFLCSLLTPRTGLRRGAFFGLILLLVMGLSLVMLLLYAHYILKLAVLILGLVLLTGPLCRDDLRRRILAALFVPVLLMVAEGVMTALIVLVFRVSMPMIADDPSWIVPGLPFFLLVYGLVFGVPALAIRRRASAAAGLPMGRFLLLPLSQAVLLGGFLYACFVSGRAFGPRDGAVAAVMVAVSVAVDFAFLKIVDDLIRKNRLETQRDLERRHYAALAEQQRAVRALRHDIANHLSTARALAREDRDRAADYLDSLTERFRRASAADLCDNRVAAAVLSAKAARAEAEGTAFRADALLPEPVGLEDTDLMSVLSNLLDNALDAAREAPEPRVEVTLRRQAGVVALRVTNTIPPGTVPSFRGTRKADRTAHGLGLSIAEEICRAHGGSLTMTAGPGLVTADALLPEDAPHTAPEQDAKEA